MLRKFAAFDVLEATLAPQGRSALRAYAHRHQFTYEPRPGYLYVRSRAISSRTNDNFDTFPPEEIKAAYASFVGKPVFVNHHNDNHRRARGVIIDAALHEDRNPDGSPDVWAEVLMEVDAVRFPKLAKAILAGHIDRTSMGTDVAYSLCSFCGNKATTPLEYCAHIPKLKGKRIHRTTASGTKEAVLVSEICHGLKFFENSLLVEEPADPTAFFTGVEDHSGMAKAASKTAAPYDPELAARQQAFWDKQKEHRAKGLCDCKGSIKIEPHKPSEHSEWADANHRAGKTDPWGDPLHQPYDGHGAWSCNNRSCAEHPQSMYEQKPGQAPGWMQAEHDPHKDLTREVGKAFHEKGLTEDARYLLDQQHEGPSKYSSKTGAAYITGPCGNSECDGRLPDEGGNCTHVRQFHVMPGEGHFVMPQHPSHPVRQITPDWPHDPNSRHPIDDTPPSTYETGRMHGPRKVSAKAKEYEPPTVSGVALRAADTGRIFMIQRSNKDEKDPARGTWEFPGGHHEEGDKTSLHAAIREWEEETGHKFPEGGVVSHTWRTGPYQGHMVVVPKESEAVDLSKGRKTVNPDDPDCDDHEQSAWWDPEHAKKNPALRQECKDNWKHIVPGLKADAGAGTHKQPLIEGHWTEHDVKPREDGSYRATCQCGYVSKPYDNHIDAYADKIEHGGSNNPDYNLERIQQRMLEAQNPKGATPPTADQRQREADHEKHYQSWTGTNPANWKLQASLVYLATERKRIKDMAPHEVEAFRKHQESGRRWHRQNPVHADNVIAHWNACTPHERETGMNWYQDAHHLTKHVASDTKTPMHVAAGLMSNYSPQTHWATNILNAAKSMKSKKGLGGSGSGIFATSKQKKAAERMHAGEHYDHVLSGPKTHAFAHLIEHGGNKDPDDPKVVIDRHALSVAAGRRARDIDYEMSGLGGKKRYKEVADVYHKAAQHISKHTGTKVEAHQVQAATWLCRQRLNAGEDKKMASYGKLSDDAVKTWNDYAGEHHPLAMGKEPGTGYSSPKDAPEDVKHSEDLMAEGHHGTLHATVPPTNPRRKDRTQFGRTAGLTYLAYGEVKAPEDVDTLRDEECPVCGEADAYDGNRCDVCGFDAPPKMFQDPNLDLAKQLDLRKQVAQDAAADPNGDGMPDVIPGHGGFGDEAPPPGAEMVPDQDDVAQQQVNQIMDQQAPLDPAMLDHNGQPTLDAAMPGAPQDPLAQDLPMDPNALPMQPEDIAGQNPVDEYGQPEPGTPGDGVPDLVCPVCGYQEDGNPPLSTDMDSATNPAEGKGALCPNCQQAPLMSAQDMADQTGVSPVQIKSSLDLAFPTIVLS